MSDLEPITQEETAWANGDIEPVTRKEQYLNRLTVEEQAIPDEPITRTEQYLAKLCGEETEIPNSPITREEAYLAYLNGEDVTLPEPITRLEQFMAFAAEKSETKPTPLTREEFYWDKYQGGAFLKDFPGLPASIVTVTDAAAKPLESLKVAITPVQSGSGDPSPDNIRPISGWTEALITNKAGKNLLEPTAENSLNYRSYSSYTIDDGVVTILGNTLMGFIARVKPNTTFTASYVKSKGNSTSFRIREFKQKPTSWNASGFVTQSVNTSSDTSGRVMVSFTTTPLTKWVVVCVYRGDVPSGGSMTISDWQLEFGSSATDYEPYNNIGTTYPITFPSEAGTVYGGTLDVVNGTLTVTHKCVDLGEYTWTKTTNAISYVGFYAVISDKMWKTESTVISSRYKATNKIRTQLNDNEIGVFNTNTSGAFRQVIVRDDTFASYTPEQVGEALNGVQYYYELASNEKVSYQLTPTEVQMLLGTNNIWADTGDILEGKYYGKRSSATRAMLNTLRDAGEITRITPEEPEETEEPEEPDENADER